MYYEINVTLNGKHLFATAPRSCPAEKDAMAVYKILVKYLPRSLGFQVTMTKWETVGTRVSIGEEQ